jgi:REP element-mobilizing transposase RayT
MHDWTSLSHVRWDCKYHVLIVPKYRQKRLNGKFRRSVGNILKELCEQKGVELLEGHLMPDHIHMCYDKLIRGCYDKLIHFQGKSYTVFCSGLMWFSPIFHKPTSFYDSSN